MTTIEEMDEFFNFDDAAHPLDQNDIDFSHLQSGPYDADLAFASLENDENSFTCIQHFSAPEEQLSMHLNNNAMADTTMMGPDDFTDFPRWIDGMDVPSNPCAYCRRMRIHCKIIKEGLRKGSCTSCVALARSCSLTHPNPHPEPKLNDSNMSSQSFGLPGNAVDDSGELDFSEWAGTASLPEPCNNCRSQGLECKAGQRDTHGSCLNCVSFACPCSLATSVNLASWNIDASNSNDNLLSPLDGPASFSQSRSTPDLVALKHSDENMNVDLGERGPKVGARFSRDSIRILRGWLSTHQNHPYPSDEEKEVLQRQTGLNKTQITNWLANARRRGKVRAPRSTSPSVRGFSDAMDIPRRGTPALENMNPLERWKHSPPEHEPASVTAIAKAVTASTLSSGRDSPYTSYYNTDDGSNRSLCNVSSTSSVGTSQSSGNSFASAYSHKSRGSFGSFGSFGNRGRRRRRRQAPKPVRVSPTATPVRTFQCTFCTETFKTKHDWQRHEKSLHLSLERWVCCPNGPTQFGVECDQCVFCGLSNPPADHAEIHNYSSCAERSLEERTFYRKDHLRQHLNLVHDVKFQNFSMESWKIVTPEIRSRCGFCGIVMDSWSIRVDHLAEHFKGGKSMADWKGDWGFEPQVLDIVENGMPPYLIHDERNTMNPWTPSKASAENERTTEDLVKIGLMDYIHEGMTKGQKAGVLTDDELLIEARRIIRIADESMSMPPVDLEISWFRDLIMLSGTTEDEVPGAPSTAGLDLPWSKRLEMIAAHAPHTSTDLSTIACSKQRSLMAFVKAKQALGLTPTDSELQAECCRILDEVENTSNYKCKGAVTWFKYLINASTCWLREFRRWANLPRSSELKSEQIRSTDDKSIDYSIHNHARLERELKEWTRFQISHGIRPSDADLQQRARLIVYKNDDTWNQTAIDDPTILHLFKRQNGLAPQDDNGASNLDLPTLAESCHSGCEEDTAGHSHSTPSPRTLHWDLENTGIALPSPSSGPNSAIGTFTPYDQPLHTLIQNQPSTNTNPTQPLKHFLNDANCYGRLVKELSRFVTTCMSPNNPSQHIPTDAEIQNQARWVVYDDDDPWNQTAADNAEWLVRFKRDVGLAAPEEGPGLPSAVSSWQVSSGGSGFAPPYLCPQAPLAPYVADVPVQMDQKIYNIKAITAAKFLESMPERWQKPATVFCSRELENGLNEYVKSEMAKGGCPSDDALRAKAREIVGGEQTAADDVQLLEKFKAMHGITQNTSPDSIPSFDDAMLAEFDEELGSMDLSGLEMPTSSSMLPLGALKAQCHTLHSSTPETPSPLERARIAHDYAEFHRVHAATASPLRRRASTKMAAQAGFSFPR